MTQNGKICLSWFITQELYIMMSFVVDKQKMIVYPGVFLFIFSKFCLFELLGGSRNGPKWQKSCDPDIIWSSFMVDIWKKIISPSAFYIYAKF